MRIDLPREAQMAGAYSEDLRVRLVRAVSGGMSARAAARLFEVSESSGVKWAQRFRQTGSINQTRSGAIAIRRWISTADGC